MTVETQRLEGLHGHALIFGGYITPEKLGRIAHRELELERLLHKASDISSVHINSVTKRALPTHRVMKKDGYRAWAVDPRVGQTPFIDLESFHFWKPGLLELVERYEEMMALPGNADLETPVMPFHWRWDEGRQIRMRDDGEIEMFSTVLNWTSGSTDGPLRESESNGGRWITHTQMMNDCRFFLIISERNFLSSLKH